MDWFVTFFQNNPLFLNLGYTITYAVANVTLVFNSSYADP